MQNFSRQQLLMVLALAILHYQLLVQVEPHIMVLALVQPLKLQAAEEVLAQEVLLVAVVLLLLLKGQLKRSALIVMKQ
jgi:hypothetical protein